jgi:hypothetical protein
MMALIISQTITLTLLLGAAGWTFYLYKQFRKAKEILNQQAQHVELLQQILTDVATGEAYAYIDSNGNTCAEKRVDREVSGYKH